MSPRPRECRRAAELISQAMDRPLTRRERWSLRLHLIPCAACRRFRRQVERIRTMLRDLPPGAEAGPHGDGDLSTEARGRIEVALREVMEGT